MVFLKGIDVIFCCNVLIYFDLASQKRVVQHFYTNLLSGGYLFSGTRRILVSGGRCLPAGSLSVDDRLLETDARIHCRGQAMNDAQSA
jgi:hypothetical protein